MPQLEGKGDGKGKEKKPLVYGLYESPLTGGEIEAMSFDAIDAEAGDHSFSPDEWVVVRRMIHTTADFALMNDVKFSADGIDSAVAALSSASPIYVDSNMIRSGISEKRLKSVNVSYSKENIRCHVADEDVAEQAKREGLPRSLFAVRKAKEIVHGGIAVFGNAPVALLELNKMIIEEGVKPALVIAMPVGFVHVVESKEELATLGVPYIVLEGRRGGSPIAVSVVHSLCAIASARKAKRQAERKPERKKVTEIGR